MMTFKEFTARLRKAGWARMSGPSNIYVSPNGTRFQAYKYTQATGVMWQHYAGRGELPTEIPDTGDGRYREI